MLDLLSWLVSGAPYALAVLMGLALPALGTVCFARFAAGAAVVIGMFTIEALYMGVGGITLGVSLYATDLVLAFIAVVAFARLLLARDAPRPHWAWLLYLLLFAVSLGTGLATHGTTAGVQARSYFYSVAAGTYAMSFPLEQKPLRTLANLLCATALLLLAVCAYRWVVYYAPIKDLLPEGGTYNIDGAIRVVRSHEALLMSQALVLGLFFSRWGAGPTAARIVMPLLLACVVVLQHRSVWAAAMAGVAMGVFVVRAHSGSRWSQALLLVGLSAVTVVALRFSDGDVSAQLEKSAHSALNGEGTAGERLEGWRAMVGNWASAGARSVAIGQSFGTPNARLVHDQTNGGLRKIDYIAHNHYVQTLYNLGPLGVVAFIVVLVHAIRGLMRIATTHDDGLAAEALLVLVVMQAVYYIPYGTDYLQHLVLGAALGHVAARRPDHAASRPALSTPARWRWA